MDFIQKFIDFIISLVAKIKDLIAGVQGIVKGETEFSEPTNAPDTTAAPAE